MDGGQCGDRATSCLTTPRYEDLPSPRYLAHSFTYLLRGPSFSEIPCTFFYIICYEDLPSPRYLAHSFTLLVMRTLLLQESLHNHLMIPIVASSQQQSIQTKLFF